MQARERESQNQMDRRVVGQRKYCERRQVKSKIDEWEPEDSLVLCGWWDKACTGILEAGCPGRKEGFLDQRFQGRTVDCRTFLLLRWIGFGSAEDGEGG